MERPCPFPVAEKAIPHFGHFNRGLKTFSRPLTFQIDNLRIFQLLDLIKSRIHIVEGEQREIFTIVSRLHAKERTADDIPKICTDGHFSHLILILPGTDHT